MSGLAKVEGYSNLRKDLSSGGVINIDASGYQAHKTAKRNMMVQIQEKKQLQDSVASLEGEINNIKDELSDIKVLLTKILNKGQ